MGGTPWWLRYAHKCYAHNDGWRNLDWRPSGADAIDQARRVAAEHVAFGSEIHGEVEFEE
jgi:hypothetical protein